MNYDDCKYNMQLKVYVYVRVSTFNLKRFIKLRVAGPEKLQAKL